MGNVRMTDYAIANAAIYLSWLICLSPLAGCGHESAASPVSGSASPVIATQSIERQSPVENVPPFPESQAPSAAGTPEVAESSVQTPAAGQDSPSAPSAGQRPRADRAPVRPGEAEKITFEDLNLGMQADVVFRPFMLTDRVNELEGKRVSIAGYMHPGQSAQRGIKKFVLLKNTQCKFGPGGQADHLTDVNLREGVTTGFTPKDVRVEGIFRIEPFQGPDGNTWSIYRLEDAQIQ